MVHPSVDLINEQAYLVLGTILFSDSPYFSSIAITSETLFGLMNGDSMIDIFASVRSVDVFVGDAYLYR